jgi:dihydrofolate reductase
LAAVLYFSISLDGYVAGPNIDRENPMGVGGESLHDWMFDKKQPADQPFIDRQHGDWGAVLIGRRTFDLGYEHWGDTPYPAPSFIVTHRAREPEKARSATFTFVTAGIENALDRAKEAAGKKDVIVMGGETARQLLALGLVDRVELQLTPILLHGGARLFDGLEKASLAFTPRGTPVTTSTTHLSYEVRPA